MRSTTRISLPWKGFPCSSSRFALGSATRPPSWGSAWGRDRASRTIPGQPRDGVSARQGRRAARGGIARPNSDRGTGRPDRAARAKGRRIGSQGQAATILDPFKQRRLATTACAMGLSTDRPRTSSRSSCRRVRRRITARLAAGSTARPSKPDGYWVCSTPRVQSTFGREPSTRSFLGATDLIEP